MPRSVALRGQGGSCPSLPMGTREAVTSPVPGGGGGAPLGPQHPVLALQVELGHSVAQEGPRWQHELQSDTQFVFQVRCRLSTAHSPWSAWSPPFLYSTPEAGGLSRGATRVWHLSQLPGVPTPEGFQSRVDVALGDTGQWWPGQCRGMVGLGGPRGLFRPNKFHDL